jgi:hypothetical protein
MVSTATRAAGSAVRARRGELHLRSAHCTQRRLKMLGGRQSSVASSVLGDMNPRGDMTGQIAALPKVEPRLQASTSELDRWRSVALQRNSRQRPLKVLGLSTNSGNCLGDTTIEVTNRCYPVARWGRIGPVDLRASRGKRQSGAFGYGITCALPRRQQVKSGETTSGGSLVSTNTVRARRWPPRDGERLAVRVAG